MAKKEKSRIRWRGSQQTLGWSFATRITNTYGARWRRREPTAYVRSLGGRDGEEKNAKKKKSNKNKNKEMRDGEGDDAVDDERLLSDSSYLPTLGGDAVRASGGKRKGKDREIGAVGTWGFNHGVI